MSNPQIKESDTVPGAPASQEEWRKKEPYMNRQAEDYIKTSAVSEHTVLLVAFTALSAKYVNWKDWRLLNIYRTKEAVRKGETTLRLIWESIMGVRQYADIEIDQFQTFRDGDLVSATLSEYPINKHEKDPDWQPDYSQPLDTKTNMEEIEEKFEEVFKQIKNQSQGMTAIAEQAAIANTRLDEIDENETLSNAERAGRDTSKDRHKGGVDLGGAGLHMPYPQTKKIRLVVWHGDVKTEYDAVEITANTVSNTQLSDDKPEGFGGSRIITTATKLDKQLRLHVNHHKDIGHVKVFLSIINSDGTKDTVESTHDFGYAGANR